MADIAVHGVHVSPLPGGLGAVIAGQDVRRGIDAGTLVAALDRYAVVVLPGQALAHADLVAFSRLLGSVVVHPVAEYLAPEHREIMILSNDWEGGKRIGAPNNGIYWHSDQIFHPRPVAYTVLYGHVVPPVAGDTLFADMRAACEALSPALRQDLAQRRAVHSFAESYSKNYLEAEPLTRERLAANPDVEHPVLRTHPHTGRRAVFVDPDSITGIVGLPAAESAAVLARLFAFLEDPAYIYCHKWQRGDVVVWDNRCLMHKTTGYDETRHNRVMWRTQIAGEVPA